jgi:hypothetical protein
MAKMKAHIAAAWLSIMLVTWASAALAAAYLQASSTDEQFATDTKPKAITMNSTDASKGLTNQNDVVTAPEDGTYFVGCGRANWQQARRQRDGQALAPRERQGCR